MRMRRRWASSSLPSFSKYASRSCSSASMRSIALLHPLVAGDVVGGRQHDQLVEEPDALAGERVDLGDLLDVVAEQLDADDRLLVGGVHLDGVAPHPELAADEVGVVALVAHVDELAEERPLVDRLADPHACAMLSRYSSGEPRP